MTFSKPFFVLLGLFALSFSATSELIAEETEISVHVLARGAKFIGGFDASVRITLKNAETGEVLARGMTEGGTGNTRQIMIDEYSHPRTLSDDSAAAFRTSLDIDRPVLVKLIAEGPLNQPQATTTVTSTQWVLPGKHMTNGDGWLVELPGLIVDLLDPPAHSRPRAGEAVTLRANITMMCGCGISPDGLWDANKTEVEAIIRRDGTYIETVSLQYAGSTSQFEGSFIPESGGIYEIDLTAWMPETNNTGLDRTSLFVSN